MFGPRIKIDRGLLASLTKASRIAGYATVDEFITHVLERAAAECERAESEDEVRKRLQGLGYMD
ncbi:MAG: hypothetical protein DWQ34_23875 [Planctomycetota bacterium]|nr:MAG: hypothetical protein DWQ34_23875 [Planctomycetota bacterium]REJ92566.1 MAG: hypothetical protein DWQ29_04610 [Planctomycetota bacterium]REK24987.1 MAG: hypothetical protein DWQ41_12985 [Planctomycetota bacterium]REK30549.1 MAG: hypothetical protein DWQ45_21985 [Planctomycetota bacterium]